MKEGVIFEKHLLNSNTIQQIALPVYAVVMFSRYVCLLDESKDVANWLLLKTTRIQSVLMILGRNMFSSRTNHPSVLCWNLVLSINESRDSENPYPKRRLIHVLEFEV